MSLEQMSRETVQQYGKGSTLRAFVPGESYPVVGTVTDIGTAMFTLKPWGEPARVLRYDEVEGVESGLCA